MRQLPNWEVAEEDSVKRLKRVVTFNNFVDAIAFAQKVADLAEDENHHPAILTEWGKVTVCWWSYKIKGGETINYTSSSIYWVLGQEQGIDKVYIFRTEDTSNLIITC